MRESCFLKKPQIHVPWVPFISLVLMFIGANTDGPKATRAKLISEGIKIKCICLNRVKK